MHCFKNNTNERCYQFNFTLHLDKYISFTIGTATSWCLPSLAEATVLKGYLYSRGVHKLELPYTWKAFGDKKGQWLMIIIGEKLQNGIKNALIITFWLKNPTNSYTYIHVMQLLYYAYIPLLASS